jgi:hypothetical protein
MNELSQLAEKLADMGRRYLEAALALRALDPSDATAAATMAPAPPTSLPGASTAATTGAEPRPRKSIRPRGRKAPRATVPAAAPHPRLDDDQVLQAIATLKGATATEIAKALHRTVPHIYWRLKRLVDRKAIVVGEDKRYRRVAEATPPVN